MIIIDSPLNQRRAELDTSKTWAQQIPAVYGSLLDPKFTKLVLNGKIIDNDVFIFNAYPRRDDLLVIVVRPQGFDPYSAIAMVIYAVVAAAISYVLARRAMGNLGDTTGKQSPNSQFQGQTNQARLYAQRPDIYGKVRAYPDITGEALVEYINNRKVVTHQFNIGLGYYDLSDFRYSDSALSSFLNSTYTVFQPGEANPLIREQFSFSEIDSSGVELPGPNDIDYQSGDPFYSATPTSQSSNSIEKTMTIIYSNPTPTIGPDVGGGGQLGDWWRNRTVGDFIDGFSIRVDYTYEKYTYIKTEDGVPVFEYVQTGASISSQKTKITYDSLTDKFTVTVVEFLGPHTDRNYIGTTGLYQTDSAYAGWYLSNVSCTELWFNFVFRRGLKGTANIEISYQPTDSDGNTTGPEVLVPISYSKYTYDDWSFTYKIASLAESFYRVRVRRTNNSRDDGADTANLESIAAIRKKTNVVHPHDTTLTITSTAAAYTTGTEMKFNVMASRKMVWWDGSTIKGWDAANGVEIPADLRSSEFVADAILHNYIVMGYGNPSEIDIAGLYAIHDKVYAINPSFVKCSITFDDSDQSLGDRVKTLALLMDVETSYDGISEFFVRDEARSMVVAQFDAHTMADDGFSTTYSFLLEDQYTGVKLEWVDVSNKNKKRYVNLKLDGSGNIITGTSFHPKEITFLGCGNQAQAEHRATLEFKKLIYQNQSASFTVFDDGFIPRYGELVRFVDYADVYAQTGEILGISGNTYETSSTLEQLVAGNEYFVTCNSSTGRGSDWVLITAWDGYSFTTETPLVGAYVADGNSIQVGSRYVIRTTEERDSDLFVVAQKTPSSDGTVQIDCVNYDGRIYDV